MTDTATQSWRFIAPGEEYDRRGLALGDHVDCYYSRRWHTGGRITAFFERWREGHGRELRVRIAYRTGGEVLVAYKRVRKI